MITPAYIVSAEVLSDNTCRYCMCDNIELFDEKRRPMNYQLMVKLNNFSTINNMSTYLSYFKCRSCGKRYPIIWQGDKPIPLQVDTRINNFVLNFIKRG